MNNEEKKDLKSGDHALVRMYNDGFFPQEQFRESMETLEVWRKLEKAEHDLERLLKKKELKLFKEITSERKEFMSLVLKDSFLCYFRMGAQLTKDILDQ